MARTHSFPRWFERWSGFGLSAGAILLVKSRSLVNVVGGCLCGTHAQFSEMVRKMVKVWAFSGGVALGEVQGTC